MSYCLYVRPTSEFTGAAESPQTLLYSWVLLDVAGQCQASGEADSQHDIEQTLAQNALEHSRLAGLIPGDEAAFCVADIPAKQQRFIAQALPYAVEEQLAQDVETLHLALGTRGAQGFPVAAIDRERMANWMSLFSNWQGLTLDALYADAALLPPTADGWSVCINNELAMLRGPAGEWLSIQAFNLAMFLQTLAVAEGETAVPVTVYRIGQPTADSELIMAEIATQGGLRVTTEHVDSSPVELLALCQHQENTKAINLCQGDFRAGLAKQSALAPWRPLIVVAAAWLILQLGLDTGLGWYYQNQAAELNAQAMGVYQQAFPDDRRTHPGNVRRVIQGQLRQNANSGPDLDFVTLMKYVGQQYSAVSGGNGLRFNSLSYNQARGELVVDLRADNYDRMSRLRNGLTAQGLRAEIGSVVNEAGATRGRLTVSGG